MLENLCHPFLMRALGTFEDTANVYFVMPVYSKSTRYPFVFQPSPNRLLDSPRGWRVISVSANRENLQRISREVLPLLDRACA